MLTKNIYYFTRLDSLRYFYIYLIYPKNYSHTYEPLNICLSLAKEDDLSDLRRSASQIRILGS